MRNAALSPLRLSWRITRRNWMVYRKDFVANVSPTFTDPMFFMLSLGLGLGSMVQSVNGHTYAQFLAPGLVASSMMMTAFFETSYGFFVRMTFENVFKAMLTTPIGAREIIWGEFIWVSLKGAAMGLGVAVVLSFFGLMSNLWLMPLIAIVGAMTAFPCGAIGLSASCRVHNINQFQTVYSFLISPIMFFSGIFFPIEQMPVPMQVLAYIFPLAHGVKISQAIFWDQLSLETSGLHFLALVGQSVILGWMALRLARKRLQN